MLIPTGPPQDRERGLVVMTGLALVTSLLLGGAAVGSWLFSGSATWDATLAKSADSAASQPVAFGATPTSTAPACHADAEGRGPLGPPIEHWRFQTGNPILAAPALIDDVLVVADWDGTVYAVDVRTGIERWRYPLDSLVDEAPVVGAGVIYVSTASSGSVHALDAATGQMRWSVTTADHPTKSPVLAGDRLLVVSGDQGTSPAVAGDTVYAGGGDDDLFVQSLDARTGAEQWRLSLDKDGLYALDVATGAVRWHLRTTSRVSAAPVIAGEWVYVVDEVLHKVDAASGRERWHNPIGGGAFVKAMAAGEMIYLATDTYSSPVNGIEDAYGWLYAFDDRSGAERWRFSIGGSVSSAPIVAGDTLYIGGFDGNLYALDRDTGEERWRLWVGGRLAAPVVACGTLYIGSYDGSLVAVANA